MFEAADAIFDNTDISIFSAAVADYAPSTVADQKIKKAGNSMEVKLEKTIDIAKTLGVKKKASQLNIGFALETENEIDHARGKIESKNFDLIVLNSLNNQGAGFGHDTNKISIIDKANNIQDFELKSKQEVAEDIINAIIAKLEE